MYVCAYRSVLHVVVLASSHRQMRNWMVEIPKCMHYAGICCVATNLKYLINVRNAIRKLFDVIDLIDKPIQGFYY